MESLGRGPYIQLSIRKLIGSSLLFLPPLPKIFVDRELPDVVTLSQSLSLILSGIVHSRSVSPLQPQKLELLKGTIMWHCTPSFLLWRGVLDYYVRLLLLLWWINFNAEGEKFSRFLPVTDLSQENRRPKFLSPPFSIRESALGKGWSSKYSPLMDCYQEFIIVYKWASAISLKLSTLQNTSPACSPMTVACKLTDYCTENFRTDGLMESCIMDIANDIAQWSNSCISRGKCLGRPSMPWCWKEEAYKRYGKNTSSIAVSYEW